MQTNKVKDKDTGKTIIITGEHLTIEDIVKVARYRYDVRLSEVAKERIRSCRKVVDKIVKDSELVYGITTGFGSLSNVVISEENTEALQENLVMSHAVGLGRPLPEDIVRAIMLLRINTFAKGFSGIKMSTVDTLIEMMNKNVYPVVPEQGSVGSSGDLAPLSHIILVMIGKGEAFLNNKRVSGAAAMKKAKIKTIRLAAKEGLALNNGTPVMTAIAALAVHDAENLLRHSILSSALSLEAIKANSSFLFEKVHLARPHAGQIIVARELRNILHSSRLVDSEKAKVQDAYSIRATPVVIGASLDAIKYVKEKVIIEINSATDNPLIFDGKAYSAANFHGQPIALAVDFLSIALSEIGNISERRIARILDPNLNEGLPAFLVKNSGLNSGFMIPQYTAAALVSENKVFSHPASVDSIPTCANQEDHVSMGTNGARKAKKILENTAKIIAIELMVAAQAVEMRKSSPSTASQKMIEFLRKHVRHLEKDRVLYPDINLIEKIIEKRDILNQTRTEINLDL